ncbi:MAG: DNA polymerase III subunit delta' [Sulfurospirillaceae bacterium]|jgi:DNA polymerase-3 subunit delta'|nr:DNA polymerase III subunit delta' [Sulfurospirillaceae bacterium]NLM99470.1 DNA polymerase III subunit delta' [Campylobacteraceae bacterium]
MSKDSLSYIALVSDFDGFIEDLREKHKKDSLKFFIKDDFLIDDAKSVIKEAYISESFIKTLILGAKNYNIYSQNSLLKILEEPPPNTKFILLATTKNALIPTIRSRVQIRDFRQKSSIEKIDLNFKKLDLKDIYEFTNKNKFINKEELKEKLQRVLVQALRDGVSLKEDDLELFSKLFVLANLNSRSSYILLTALLVIYKRLIK